MAPWLLAPLLEVALAEALMPRSPSPLPLLRVLSTPHSPIL